LDNLAVLKKYEYGPSPFLGTIVSEIKHFSFKNQSHWEGLKLYEWIGVD